MIDTGVIDLADFGPQYGLFGDFENSRFSLVLPRFQLDFEYDGYYSPVTNTVEFEGSPLILTLRGENELVAQYRLNDRERTTVLVRVEDDIDGVIAAERERRRALLEQILERGNTLLSTAYGTITIGDTGLITWEGYERLVPSVLPGDFNGTARIEFSLYPAAEIRSRYDGAFRIRIDGTRSVHVLYTITADGIRLVHVPEALIEDRIIISEEPRSPVVMFYRFGRS
jgi:hypothetical protein